MNADADELRVVRQLLQEAIARAERAEAECVAMQQRPYLLVLEAFQTQGRHLTEIVRELEDACRELARLRAATDNEGEGF